MEGQDGKGLLLYSTEQRLAAGLKKLRTVPLGLAVRWAYKDTSGRGPPHTCAELG